MSLEPPSTLYLALHLRRNLNVPRSIDYYPILRTLSLHLPCRNDHSSELPLPLCIPRRDPQPLEQSVALRQLANESMHCSYEMTD